MIVVKRIYEPKVKGDGYRVLVDRLWPRGVSKADAALDLWLKDIAPTDELRKWFNHDPAKWPEFQEKYLQELKDNKAAVNQLKSIIKEHQIVTLLYGAKDPDQNQAIVIARFLKH